MRKALTFGDVCLVPRYNNIRSRSEPNLSSWLTKNREVGLPLIPANMDTVIGTDLAIIIAKNGGVPLFHRFTTLERKIQWLKEFPNCFISSGINENSLEEIEKLIQEYGLKGIVLDVAHGHSVLMINMITSLKNKYSEIEVIAGNICTARAYHDLVNAGADAVKVGIGPGAACTTRIVTGFGVPQFTAIRDCAEEADHFRIPIIADGGIKSSKDVALALAAGASTVMIGKLFALTNESAAEKQRYVVGIEGQKFAKYRGQASEDFQNEFYGGLKEKTVAEGTDFWAPVSGSAQELIDDLLGGLRSAMTYGGARSIKELHRKAEFVEVTAAYEAESKPRRE